MVQFPERLEFIHGAGKSAQTALLALDEKGQQRKHFDPGVQYGLYAGKTANGI